MTPQEIKAKSEELSHISTEEMEKDLMDTEREILELEENAKHLESTPRSSTDYKMNMFRASSRRLDIESRNKFCLRLQELISYRKAMKQI